MGGLTLDKGRKFDGVTVFQRFMNKRYLFYLHVGHSLSVDSLRVPQTLGVLIRVILCRTGFSIFMT